MICVYIASPYSIGDQKTNVRRQIDVANKLMNLGYCPIVPLLNHYQDIVHPRSEEDWKKIDNEMVIRSDAVLRLPGESAGADAEVELAKRNMIPVVYSIDELDDYFC